MSSLEDDVYTQQLLFEEEEDDTEDQIYDLSLWVPHFKGYHGLWCRRIKAHTLWAAPWVPFISCARRSSPKSPNILSMATTIPWQKWWWSQEGYEPIRARLKRSEWFRNKNLVCRGGAQVSSRWRFRSGLSPISGAQIGRSDARLHGIVPIRRLENRSTFLNPTWTPREGYQYSSDDIKRWSYIWYFPSS